VRERARGNRMATLAPGAAPPEPPHSARGLM